jgi:hypothetical protein
VGGGSSGGSAGEMSRAEAGNAGNAGKVEVGGTSEAGVPLTAKMSSPVFVF